jgi:hypothetical protein
MQAHNGDMPMPPGSYAGPYGADGSGRGQPGSGWVDPTTGRRYQASRVVPRPDAAVPFVLRRLAEHPDADLFVWLKNAYRKRRHRDRPGPGEAAHGEIVRSTAEATVGGFFDRVDEVMGELFMADGVSVYVCPNPIRRADRGEYRNSLQWLRTGQGVQAGDVERLDYLIVDIDPIVEGGRGATNATDAENLTCMELMADILDGEPLIERASLWGTSGNGSYILTRVDLPNDHEAERLARAFLSRLAKLYGRADAEVDLSWWPGKSIAMPGSLKCRGPDTAERPRRVATIEGLDRPLQVFPVAEWVASHRRVVEAHEPRYLGPSDLPPVPPPTGARTGSASEAESRAIKWLLKRPVAVEGHCGRLNTMRTIRVVMYGWGKLNEEDVARIIAPWAAACKPRWSDKELAGLIKHAASHPPGADVIGFMFKRGRPGPWTLGEDFRLDWDA